MLCKDWWEESKSNYMAKLPTHPHNISNDFNHFILRWLVGWFPELCHLVHIVMRFDLLYLIDLDPRRVELEELRFRHVLLNKRDVMVTSRICRQR